MFWKLQQLHDFQPQAAIVNRIDIDIVDHVNQFDIDTMNNGCLWLGIVKVLQMLT